MKSTARWLLTGLFAVFLVTQSQPILLRVAGAVGGSFGVRSLSHDCLGFIVDEYKEGVFRPGELEFRFFLFHFRYSVLDALQRPLCIGQDIWYGE